MVMQIDIQEIAPIGYRRWLGKQGDVHAQLENRFLNWMTMVTTSEKLFNEHIYDNPECSDLDLRQHRQALHHVLALGEGLAIDFLELESESAAAYVNLVDQKIGELQTALFQWHAPVGDDEIPPSLKESLGQVKAVDLSDLAFKG